MPCLTDDQIEEAAKGFRRSDHPPKDYDPPTMDEFRRSNPHLLACVDCCIKAVAALHGTRN